MVKKWLISLLIVFLFFEIAQAIEIGGGWQTEKIYSPQIDFLRRAENIVYNLQGAIKKRPPMTHHSSVALHGPAYGMFDFWRSGITGSPTEKFIVRIGDDISYYSDSEWTLIHSPAITSLNIPMDFAIMGDKCVIGFANDAQPLQWDQGNTWSGMPELSGCGNSWMFEKYHDHIFAAGNPAYPSRVYISVPLVHRDSIDFTGTGSTTIDIDPDDGDQIIGMKAFLGACYVFKGPNRLSIHKITGTSIADFTRALVVEGVSGFNNTIIQFGNDLAFIDPNGVHTLSASVDFGGVREAFLSAPIQTFWNNLKYDYLDRACGVHVPELHSLLFAVPLAGYFYNTDIIGYDYLAPNLDGSRGRWFRWPNLSVNCMTNRTLSGCSRAYFGTHKPSIVLLNTTSTSYSDYGSEAYTGLLLTPYIYGESMDTEKQVEDLGLVIRPTIDSNITGTLIIDSQDDQTFYFDQSGEGARLGTFVLGTDTLMADRMKVVYPLYAQPGGTGRNISLRFENATLNADMQIHHILLYLRTIPGIKHD